MLCAGGECQRRRWRRRGAATAMVVAKGIAVSTSMKEPTAKERAAAVPAGAEKGKGKRKREVPTVATPVTAPKKKPVPAATGDDAEADSKRTTLLEEAGSPTGDGAVLSLWERKHIALAAHYVCIGVVNGILQNALQPYCQYVVHGAPNQCSTLATFVNLPWGYKFAPGVAWQD